MLMLTDADGDAYADKGSEDSLQGRLFQKIDVFRNLETTAYCWHSLDADADVN